jgi:acetyl esterase/lipase
MSRLMISTLAACGIFCWSFACRGSDRAQSASLQRSASEHRDLIFTTAPRPLRLDLFTPDGEPPFPVVVWVHGGAWLIGEKTLPSDHAALRQLSRGYAVASIEYRLSGEAIFPAQIHDCKAAIRWLRANAETYGLNPARIAVWGSSAGGHLVALLGTSSRATAFDDLEQGSTNESSTVQAVVDWYGPTDFLRMTGGHHEADSPESQLLGCDIDMCPDRVALASPLTYVDSDDPPFFIQHGTRDQTVDFEQSQILHAALMNAGVPSTFVPIHGAGHGGPEFSTPENLELIEQFLDRHLKLQ